MAIRVKLPNGEIGEFPDEMSHEEIESVLQKQFPPENQSTIEPTPYNNIQSIKPEGTGFKGLASDVANNLSNALKTGRGFIKDIPSNLEKSGKYIEENPVSSIFHNIGQLGAGTAEVGKTIANSPHDLLKYLLKKKLAIDIPIPGTNLNTSDLIPHIPEDTGLEKILGLEVKPERGDKLIRALPDIAALAIPGTKGIKSIYNAAKNPDLKMAIRETQAKVNSAKKELGNAFETVAEEVEKRGISNIPIDKNIISQAQKFLDKTPESKNLIIRAKNGDYNALRDLQADLREIGETALSNKLTTERKIGKEALSTRRQINNSIEEHFKESGHKDLAKLLNQTKEGYADLQGTYFSNPALAKVFGKSQKVPKNPITLLTEESTEMKKFFEAHPEIEKMLGKALKHKRNMGLLKSAGKIAGTALGVEEIGRMLHK